MIKTVLVTGAYGFLGRSVAINYSKKGFNVVGAGHAAWKNDEWRMFGMSEWREGDIAIDMLASCGVRPDVIVHCAGSGSVGFSLEFPYHDFQRTVMSTLAVLEFVRLLSPATRIVYPSSAAVYGISKILPISEDNPLLPVSPYGMHKKFSEELCQSYAERFDVSVSIVRFFSIYGDGLKKQLLWDACKKIQQGINYFSGNGMEMRDWLHIDDAVNLIGIAAKNASNRCSIVNGGSGEGVTVQEILKEVFLASNAEIEPAFSNEVRIGDPAHYIADINSAIELGWRPKIKWREGIHNYVNWFNGLYL